MDYIDEEFLELKKRKKIEQHQSLNTGFYIQDELIEFERIKLRPISISLMLPSTFVTMPQSIVKVKYPSENRPQIIKTSLDTRINFSFSKLPHQVLDNQLPALLDQFQTMIKRINPANVFFEKTKVVTDENMQVCWFDYKGYALDEQVYYLVYILSLKDGNLLHGTFNCEYRHMEEWKKAVGQVMLSIKTIE